MKEWKSSISGMHCQSCKARIEKKLKDIVGVADVHVSLIQNMVHIVYDENVVDPKDFGKTIQSLGYECKEEYGENTLHPQELTMHYDHHSHEGQTEDPLKVTLEDLAMNSEMMGHHHHEEKSSSSKSFFIIFNLLSTLVILWLSFFPENLFYGYLAWILSTIILVSNLSVLKAGLQGLWYRAPNMYSLVFLGALSGYLYSIFMLLLQTFHKELSKEMLFFDASSAVLSFLALGELAQAKGTELVKKNLGSIKNDFPTIVYKIVPEGEKAIFLKDVEVGDILTIRAGDMIPFDGFLESKNAQIVETLLTGEIRPVEKKMGESVLSGTYVHNSSISLRVSRSLKEGFFYKVKESLMEIERKKTPILELVDKISYYFVPFVILLSVLAFLFWGFWDHSWSYALKVAISILVIACPCALGLATPLALMVFFGTTFRAGFLVRNTRILSLGDEIDACIMDKTGTLTQGNLSVVEWGVLRKEALYEEIYALESQSSHPYARAIIRYLEEQKVLSPPTIRDFLVKEGLGVEGMIKEHKIVMGNSELIPLDEEKKRFEQNEANKGRTVIWVLKDEENEGFIVLEDELRVGAKEWVAFAKKNYQTLSIFSGDTKGSVAFLAGQLDIKDFSGGLKPFSKLERLESMQKEGKKVLMIGDGLNDSLVLAKADLSLSFGEKTNLGGQSGDILSLSSDMRDFISLLQFSKKTNRIIRQNLFWAFIYNLLALPWAMGLFMSFGWGMANPLWGALGMALSSLLVVGNSLRLRRFR